MADVMNRGEGRARTRVNEFADKKIYYAKIMPALFRVFLVITIGNFTQKIERKS